MNLWQLVRLPGNIGKAKTEETPSGASVYIYLSGKWY